MNARQKEILTSWRHLLKVFISREWFSLFIASALGVLAAGGVDLLLRDSLFQAYLLSKYELSVAFDDPQHYIPYLTLAIGTMLLAVAGLLSNYLRRALKSWWAGVTSGLVLMPFLSSFVFTALPPSTLHHRFVLGSSVISMCLLSSFLLYLRAEVTRNRIAGEDELRVPLSVRSIAGTQLEDSDDPIQTWAQDALGRASLVDSLSVKIMIAKAPVLWLSGAFGSGKTSTLNLLREHLGDKTITISFSTWLPGSAETLASYLMSDIASECRKRYVVPGLRRGTRRLAAALGGKVPLLSDYLKLLPGATQKDDIDDLKSALVRLPKRVVVLLDEIDRMAKEELITLLKVIRGISNLPNLTFVCAGDRETIVKTIEKDNEYFEKFYPVLIPVPEPEPAELRKAGTERLVSVFVDREWFETKSETNEFRKLIESLWDARIAPFCRNLRAIGLLANDVGVAAAPLRREVDPVDLTLIEMLRRFRPVVYELVARNSLALTGGESLVRGGPFQTDEDRAESKTKFLADLKKALPKEEEFEPVKGVLFELFPFLSKGSGRLDRQRPKRKDSEEESDKRIREAGMFPAYFRYELPEAIFSSVELASMLQQFERVTGQTARETAFLDALNSMPKGSLKRDDFLRKLADSAKSIAVATAKSLGEAAVKAAANYTYDMTAVFGEAGHVLRMILLIAQRLSEGERVTFLRQCILIASDDTMAFQILTVLTRQKDDSNIGIHVRDLYSSFIGRMRRRYGRNVDAANIDLSTSDPWALDLWGQVTVDGITADPEDRQIQYAFWRRYIGNSRARLAQAFRGFFLPVALYREDPTSMVENKFPVAEIKKLYDELPQDPDLTDLDQKSLSTMQRFLAGEFKNGTDPMTDFYQ